MKHLKKLTRKGLDELAKEMPQVNERQQSGMVGGEEYFDYGGRPVMSTGGNDYIYVIDEVDSNWYAMNRNIYSGGQFALGVKATSESCFVHKLTFGNEIVPFEWRRDFGDFDYGWPEYNELISSRYILYSGSNYLYSGGVDVCDGRIANAALPNILKGLISGYAPSLDPNNLNVIKTDDLYVNVDATGNIAISYKEDSKLSVSDLISRIKAAESGYLQSLNSGI